MKARVRDGGKERRRKGGMEGLEEGEEGRESAKNTLPRKGG